MREIDSLDATVPPPASPSRNVVRLDAQHMTATIDVARGGRVQTVFDRRSSRELLYQRRPRGGDDYLTTFSGGWDELFPNDAPWRGQPDHGRLWDLSLEIKERSPRHLIAQGELKDPLVSIVRLFELNPERPVLRTVTTLRAHGSTGPWLWASHPMLAVQPGWSVHVDSENFEADVEVPGRFAPGGLAPKDVDLARVVPRDGAVLSEVVYVRGCGEAAVKSNDGRFGTRLSWDRAFFPDLWLVTLAGMYGIDLTVLLEAATCCPFRLDEAIEQGLSRRLSAGQQVSWWTELESLDNQ